LHCQALFKKIKGVRVIFSNFSLFPIALLRTTLNRYAKENDSDPFLELYGKGCVDINGKKVILGQGAVNKKGHPGPQS